MERGGDDALGFGAGGGVGWVGICLMIGDCSNSLILLYAQISRMIDRQF